MEYRDLVELALTVAGSYLALGVLFAIPFLLVGVKRIDPDAAEGTWGFRVLIAPGVVLLWPALARRWFGGQSEPREERNAHRDAANRGASS